jgi:hypothetical protein
MSAAAWPYRGQMSGDGEPDTPLPALPSRESLRAALRAASDLPVPRPPRRRVQVGGVDPDLVGWADLARADLAARLDLPVDTIVVAAVGSVTWSDRSCGCPQPGMAYPQVPVDGAYARLDAAGRSWHYHGGGDRGPFLCEP